VEIISLCTCTSRHHVGEEQLKQQSACSASAKPRVQIPVPPKNKQINKNIMQHTVNIHKNAHSTTWLHSWNNEESISPLLEHETWMRDCAQCFVLSFLCLVLCAQFFVLGALCSILCAWCFMHSAVCSVLCIHGLIYPHNTLKQAPLLFLCYK
jgi:hypothetical protein